MLEVAFSLVTILALALIVVLVVAACRLSAAHAELQRCKDLVRGYGGPPEGVYAVTGVYYELDNEVPELHFAARNIGVICLVCLKTKDCYWYRFQAGQFESHAPPSIEDTVEVYTINGRTRFRYPSVTFG